MESTQSGQADAQTVIKTKTKVKKIKRKLKVLKTGLEGKKGVFADVYVKLGLTINIGDYESARIDVGVSMPCKPGKAIYEKNENGKKKIIGYKGIIETREITHNIVSDLLKTEWKELKGSLENLKNPEENGDGKSS